MTKDSGSMILFRYEQQVKKESLLKIEKALKDLIIIRNKIKRNLKNCDDIVKDLVAEIVKLKKELGE